MGDARKLLPRALLPSAVVTADHVFGWPAELPRRTRLLYAPKPCGTK